MDRSRLYPFLRFDTGVDWGHVEPQLLQALNRLAAAKGVVVDINSGYRTPAHSVAVGGFADDPHTRGIAVDAYVNGKPVGQVFTARQFKAAGLITGNVPGFFNGKPDPEHVQLPSSETSATTDTTTVATAPTDPTPQQPPSAPDDTGSSADDTTPTPVSTPAPPSIGPGVSARPEVAAPVIEANRVADLWRQVADQGLTSPETSMLAANAVAIGSGASAAS